MAILKAAIITVTPFQQNCSVIWKEDTKIAAVTDPGGDLELIEKFIEDQNLTCLLYTSPSPRDLSTSRMPSSA